MSKNLKQKSLFLILIAIFSVVYAPLSYAFFYTPDLFFQNDGWKKIEIPEAVCGFGQSYSIYLKQGNEKKIAFNFAPGGACWNFATCVGPTLHALLFERPSTIFTFNFLQSSEFATTIAEHTKIFFPYCTGDAYAGDHVANYLFQMFSIHHKGHSNIIKAINYLEKEGYTHIRDADQVVSYGISAGAVGALIHLPTINRFLSPHTDRVLISDSPGLHFGNSFFDKFTPEMKADFHQSFGSIGMTFNDDQGNLAKKIQTVCDNFPKWRMGFLQSSDDIIMSSIFGSISPREHRKLIYSKEGIYSIYKNDIKGTSNCHAWIINGFYHTYLLTDITAKFTVNGTTAIDFVRNLILNDSTLHSSLEQE